MTPSTGAIVGEGGGGSAVSVGLGVDEGGSVAVITKAVGVSAPIWRISKLQAVQKIRKINARHLFTKEFYRLL